MRLLFYGGYGWIGGMLVELAKEGGHEIRFGQARLEDFHLVVREIGAVNPDRVICTAGVTGTPNVDWCEDHRNITILGNVTGPLNLAAICHFKQVHLTVFGSGCVYSNYKDGKLVEKKTFTETDPSNFTKSFYSKTKAYAQDLLTSYDNVLLFRLRMPVSADLHPKSLLTKLIGYKEVVNVANSISILPDLLPIALDLTVKGKTGVFNLVNPGPVTHSQILHLYQHSLDPTHTFTTVDLADHDARLVRVERSACILSCQKLTQLYPVPRTLQSLCQILNQIRASRQPVPLIIESKEPVLPVVESKEAE